MSGACHRVKKYACNPHRLTRNKVIMQVLKEHPEGLSIKRIITLSEKRLSSGTGTYVSLLHKLIKDNKIIFAGYRECPCCGSNLIHYKGLP